MGLDKQQRTPCGFAFGRLGEPRRSSCFGSVVFVEVEEREEGALRKKKKLTFFLKRKKMKKKKT